MEMGDPMEANRTGSQMSSIKENDEKKSIAQSEMDDEKARIGPPYDPLVPQMWQAKLREFANLNIIKFPRIFQTFFYLLQYSAKENICVELTNALEWKKCRDALSEDSKNDIFKMLADYQFEGPKDNEFKLYESLVFLKRNIEDFNVQDVADYSQALAHLLIWLRSGLELRVQDVNNRRAAKRAAKALREDAIENEEARVEKRNTYVEEKKEDFEKRMEDER